MHTTNGVQLPRSWAPLQISARTGFAGLLRTGRLHLVCSDLTSDYDAITTTYKKRWKVEVFHKSLKSNAGMAKSPTQTLRTQSNHVFMAIYAVFKLECLSVKSKINPFALRFKLLINATRSAFDQLQKFQAAS